jgi:uncharacterized protein (DUF1330 family)
VSVTLCVLLWANPGAENGLIAYEDRVLAVAEDHGGAVLQRVRGNGSGGQPLEVQTLRFPSRDALDAFMIDDRRQALAAERERAIARTEVIEVDLVEAATQPD